MASKSTPHMVIRLDPESPVDGFTPQRGKQSAFAARLGTSRSEDAVVGMVANRTNSSVSWPRALSVRIPRCESRPGDACSQRGPTLSPYLVNEYTNAVESDDVHRTPQKLGVRSRTELTARLLSARGSDPPGRAPPGGSAANITDSRDSPSCVRN